MTEIHPGAVPTGVAFSWSGSHRFFCSGSVIISAQIVLAVILLLSCASILAQEERAPENQPEKRLEQQEQLPNGIIDRFHYQAGQRLSDFIGQIDEFFGGEEESARVNESWARVRIDLPHNEEEGADPKANIKFKLVLPRAEERFRLLLSTDDEDSATQADRVVGADQENNSNVSFALRFIRSARTNGGVKYDVGIRSRDSKQQTFVRFGAFLRQPLNDNWTGTVTNNAYYFHSSGFINKLTFKFERSYGQDENWVFQSSTLFGWIEGQKGATADHVFGLYRALSPTSSVAFEFLSSALTAPAPGVKRLQGGTVRIRLRRNLWRPWFYLEFWPTISWPIEYNFKSVYGLRLRVEALIGPHD